jgi:class 3 adenylate cyclase/predicted ATPase
LHERKVAATAQRRLRTASSVADHAVRSYDPGERQGVVMGGQRRAGDAAIELRLLGPLELSRGRDTVALGGPKPRALLAVLALEPGHVVSVDRLVEALWPGETPDSAAHAVQVYISQLRKSLGADLLPRRAPGYSLELEPERVDLHRFVELASDGRKTLAAGDPASATTVLREALALWRGPALADFLYEPFAQTEIARLEELRTVVLEERIDADLALGRHAELVSELEALVQTQPLRERPRGQLMLALYRSGRQADALAAYRAAHETLIEELGIEPGPQLKQLEAAILRQDESLLPAEPLAAPAMQYRRLVTILFADIVDFLALADSLDPEALHGVMRRYFDLASATLTRHGGTVEKFAGDAVMAVFGVPISHEDDALRASRAALDIQASIVALNEALAGEIGIGFEVRIGIESGEVLVAQEGSRQRLVTGDAVGVASRLEQAAAPGEIVVGELTRRLIGQSAQLEALGDLEVKGKREPIAAFRLCEIAPPAPAFERRQDAPFVGRRKELGVLRKALRSAIGESRAGLVALVGPAGIGKSRLAFELGRRAKDATVLSGRCLSYGDGITYWPLREIVRKAAGNTDAESITAALAGGEDAGQVADLLSRALSPGEAPPPAPEIAWAFRRFCELLARRGPLVVLLDDLHWAEPTFLDLVEHLADRGEGPILVFGVAREELLEDRPTFVEERASAEQLVLDTLTLFETESLLDGLGAETLPAPERERIAETAGGNPFYVEQLLALASEGGFGADRPLPETIQALLAARLDRLGPGERAVLERGAVVGKEFGAEDVSALLEPAAAPTAGAHLRTLAGRGFVRSAGDDDFRFRHVLVQEAVYRATPKRLRAELHERFADRLERTAEVLAELDEFVGYHLEQAYRLRSELGETDRRAERLAEDAGRRLGAAGVRALKRGDMPATTNLLGRATSLLPEDEPLRRELLCELGIALRTSGDPGRAESVLAMAIRASQETRDRRIELRARIEREYVQLLHEPGTTSDLLLDYATEGVPTFEKVGDDRSLGRAWLLTGFVQGGHLGRHRTWEEAAERALVHYRNSGWPTSTCLGEITAALYYGPAPVGDAIARCEQLLRDEVSDRAGSANVLTFTGGLVAQRGDFDEARALLKAATATYQELGQRTVLATYCGTVLGDVELLAGDAIAAERTLAELCHELARSHDWSHLASSAGDLAEALYVHGRLDEAEQWTRAAEKHAASDDLDAQIKWRTVRAKILARRGAVDDAEELAREGARLSEQSDGLNWQAKASRDLGEVLEMAGRHNEAVSAFERAIELYEQKGNLAGAAQVRSLDDDLAVV